MSHGIVIGKFYPPHNGHHYLIEEAAKSSSQLTVVVMCSEQESITLATRVALLRAIHPSPRITIVGIMDEMMIDLQSESTWEYNVQLIKHAVKKATSNPIEYLYTSEEYGPELAKRLGARHILVDIKRLNVPISATLIRSDLGKHWQYLHPLTRDELAMRIVFVGAESTGTTTVSEAVSKHYSKDARTSGSIWVPEYGRQYTLEILEKAREQNPAVDMADIVWTGRDFASIGLEQNRLEKAAAKASSLVICDTDAWATRVWERRYIGGESEETRKAVPNKDLAKRGLYFVTSHIDVPFEQDGIRDGEHIRADMTDWFLDDLTKDGHSWVLLSGTLEERIGNAIQIIDRLRLNSKLREPLGEIRLEN